MILACLCFAQTLHQQKCIVCWPRHHPGKPKPWRDTRSKTGESMVEHGRPKGRMIKVFTYCVRFCCCLLIYAMGVLKKTMCTGCVKKNFVYGVDKLYVRWCFWLVLERCFVCVLLECAWLGIFWCNIIVEEGTTDLCSFYHSNKK